MNILFDLITIQATFCSGASEYVRSVFYSLLEVVKQHPDDIKLFAIIDSSIKQYPYKDITPDKLKEKGIAVVDINKHTLKEIIKKYEIDTLFVGLAQKWAGSYSFEGVKCNIIIIIHDMHDEEMESIRLYGYLSLFSSPYRQIRQILARIILKIKKSNKHYKTSMYTLFKELKNNKYKKYITVSEYTKYSLMYHYGIEEKQIQVLYSPERLLNSVENIENKQLAKLIQTKRRYYLIVSANRPEKNAMKTIQAFKRFCKLYTFDRKDNLPMIVTVGMRKGCLCKGHIDLPFLSESDLVHTYKNCYAIIYSSFFEGFGYPPMEAMKFSKPVLASNVTSIPEILGYAPIYFSPFYVSSIFSALCQLNDDNYDKISQRSLNRYKEIHEKQIKDLNELIFLMYK